MERREFLAYAGGLIPAMNISQNTKSKETPNIIWLIADDLGWNDLGCFGNSSIRTPHIDKLGNQGLKFTQAFVTSPQCSPSRSSAWTGKYAHSTGTEDLHAPLPQKEKILPQYLKSQNYFSGNVGKLHLGKSARKKFDFIGNNIDTWKKFIKIRPKKQPFFLALGFHQPHRPFKYKTKKFQYKIEEVIVPPFLPDLKRVRTDLTRYYNEVSKMDAKIGTLVDYLNKENLLDNTLIIFWSDNGLPFPRAKGQLYDPGIGTPVIFYWKGHIKPGIYDHLTSTIDFVPTLLDLTDIKIPDSIHGRSFYSVLNGNKQAYRDYIYSERNWHDLDDHIRSIRTDKFKYIRNYLPWKPYTQPADVYGSPSFQAMRKAKQNGRLTGKERLIFRWPRPVEELYDLSKDPHEFKNLANKSEYSGIKEELRDKLKSWENRTNDVPVEKRKPDKYNYNKLFKKNLMDSQN